MRKTITGLSPGITYAIQVRSRAGSEVSEWSRTFIIDGLYVDVEPAQPQNFAGQVKGDSFVFTWDAVTKNADDTPIYDLSRYEVMIKNNATNVTVAIPTTETTLDFSFNRNLAAFGDPAASITAYVEAVDREDNRSLPSNSVTLTNPPPGPVQNLNVTGILAGIDVTWEPPLNLEDDFKEYRVHVGDNNGFVLENANLVWRGQGTAYTYQTLSDVDHYFKVVAVDKFNSSSTTVTAGPVRPIVPTGVDGDAPATPTSLAGTISGTTMTVTWVAPPNPDNDLAGYTIRYRPTGTTVWSTAQATHEQTSTTIQVEEYKNYDLQIQAWDFNMNRSDWSSIVTATGATNVAPAVPGGVTIIGGMQTAMVKWDAVADADLKEYEVQFSDVSPSSDSTPTPVKVSGTITSFTNLDANKTYYARVRAVDTGGLKSAWSSIVSDNVGIVITSPTDGNPPPSSPAPTATSGIGTIFLSWNPVPNLDPVTYEIHMGTTTGFTPGPGTKVGETASTFTNISKGPGGSALAYGTNYYFKIIAKDDDGPAAASAASGAAQNLKVGLGDTQNVKTDGNPPASSPTPTVTGSIKSLFVKWDAVANNDPVVYEVHVGTTNNFTAGAGTKVGETSSTFTTITKLPDGNDLDYGTTYYVRLIAKDADGAAAVSAASSGATAVYVPTQSDLNTLDGRIDNAIKSSVIEYAVNSSESTPPAGGWSSATPTRTPGQFIWFRTVITYGDDTTSTSSPALLTGNTGPAGTPAKYITLAATTQVLSSPPGGGATTPATAVITGTATNTTITTWEYKVDGGSFVTTAPTGVSRTGNEVTITGSTFAGKTITVRMTDGATASDEITVAKVSDGAAGGAGQDAITVILTNESHTFPGDVNNALAGSTTTEIRAFKGSTAQNITVGTITGAVTGLSASLTSGQGTTSPLITFTATTALTATSGKFTIPLTIDGKAFNKEFSWSVARKGATGAAGVGVASTEIRYQVHTNGTTAPTGTWLSSVPATSPGQFLWTRTVTNYTDSTSSTSYSVAAHGATGAAGTGITGTVVNYAKSSDGVNAPASGWGTSIPSTSPGEFLWTRTVTSYSSGSPTTAYSVAAHGQTGPPGADAKTISVTATSQVMTHAAATPTTTSPATVTVTATPVNTTVTTWQYAVDGGSFTGTKPAYVSTPSSNQVTVTGSTMTNKTVSIRAADASGNADSITIAKVSDGATGSTGGQGPAGADAYTVLLGNEAHTFPGSTTAAIAGNTVVPVIAYKGSTQVAATIGTITGQVTGLTTSIQNNGTTTAQFTVTVTTSLTTQAGVLTVPITVDGNTFTKRFSWAVSRTGSPGPAGNDGVSITSVTPFFRAVTAGSAAPAQPTGTGNPAGWSTTEPSWTANTDLYRTERILYSNSTASWTPVTKVSTYEAAAIAITADKRVQSAERAPNKTTDIVNVPVGAFFYEYGAATSPGTGTVLKQTYIWDGSDWQPRGIDRTFIPAVDIGTGTFGDLNGNRLVANSVTANKIDVTDLVAQTAWMQTLTTSTAFVDNAIIKAANITGTLTIGQLPSDVATDSDVDAAKAEALAAAMDAARNADNLLANPSFEYDMQGWTANAGVWTITSSDARTGAKSLTAGTGSGAFVGPAHAVVEGQKILISAWAKTSGDYVPGSGGGGLSFSWSTNGGSTWTDGTAGANILNISQNTSWTYYEMLYTVPAGVTHFRFRLRKGHTTGTVWYDDVAMRDVTLPLNEAAAVEARTLSRSTDMVTNGTGYLKSNYNFSSMTFNPADAPAGANGSFVPPEGSSAGRVTDEFIPVDPAKAYRLSVAMRQTNTGAPETRAYTGLVPHDAAGNSIQPYHYMYRSGTTTELTQELKPGDTVIHVTSTSGWDNGATTTWRSIIIWDYTDPFGKKWPEHTYSRIYRTNAYAQGGLTSTTITLSSPWTGTTHAVGTKISNGGSGGSYMYGGWNNSVVTEEWVSRSGTFGPGLHSTPLSAATTKFPPGTASVKIVFLPNRQPGGSAEPLSKHAIASVSLSDAAAAQATAGEVKDLTDGWKYSGTTEINGGVIRTNTITSTQIATNTITAESGIIADAAITTAKIADLAVSNAKISDLHGSKITANTIAVSKLMVEDIYNYAENPLPNTKNPGEDTGWLTFPAGVALVAGTNTTTGNGVIRITGSTNSNNKYVANAMRIPVREGERFLLTAKARTNSGLSSGNIGFIARPYNSSGTALSDQIVGGSGVAAAANGATKDVELEYVVPSGVSAVSFGPWVNGSQNGIIDYFDFQFRRKNAGNLIVDGSITTTQLNTTQITSDNTFTTNLIANAATIGALTFDKIEGGTGIIKNVDIKSTLTIRPGGKIVVADTGTIESSNFGANAGYRLTNNSLEINEGVIKAAALETQIGRNLVPGEYADFEMPTSTYSSLFTQNATFTVNNGPGAGKFGRGYLRLVSGSATTSYVYLGSSVTDYNISVEPGEYILSGYVRGTGSGVSTVAHIHTKASNGNFLQSASKTVTPSSTEWDRIHAVVTVPEGVNALMVFLYSPTTSASAQFDVDGIQLERKTSTSSTPSAWMPGSNYTRIDGSVIRTGEIRSNIDGPISGQPAWSINMAGGAQFGNAAIRGTLVVGTAGGESASFVQSANYVAGGTGWKIDGAGVGEFNTLKLGNTIIQKDWIETGGFKADYITGGNIYATLTLTGGIIRTAASGARTEMTDTGLKVYNGLNQVILDATGGSVSAIGTLSAKSSPTTNEGIIIGPTSASGYLTGRIEFSPTSALHNINPFISHGTESGAGMVEVNGGRNLSTQSNSYIRVVGGHFNNNGRGIIRLQAGQIYIGESGADTIVIGDGSGDYLTSIQSRTITLGNYSTALTRSVDLGSTNLRWLSSTGTPIASISRDASNHLTVAANNNLYLTSGASNAIYMEGYDVSGAWQSYTPSWLGTTTNPATTGHTRTGRYKRIGKTVHVNITITVGTSGVGSGLYMFTLPFNAASGRDQILQAYILASGSGEVGGIAKIEAATPDRVNRVYLVNQTRANNWFSAFGNTYPVTTLPSGSVINIAGTYECA
jgi:hypothetical protein